MADLQGLDPKQIGMDNVGVAGRLNTWRKALVDAIAVSADTILTTRGDLLTRSASALVRLGVGAANTVLRSDGTDPSWGKIVNADITDDTIAVGKLADGTAGQLITWDATGEASTVATGTSGQVLTSNGAGAAPTMQNLPVDVALVAASRNCIVTNNAVSPDSQIDIDADEVIAKTTSFAPTLLTAVNLTADITASGANGLDTGSEASSTWYYVYVIHNPGTPATASLLSLSATAPTMPSGYTYKALVGAVFNNASSNFIKVWGLDRRMNTEPLLIFTATAAAADNTYESVSIAAGVPGAARMVKGQIGSTANSGSKGFGVAGDANGVGEALGHWGMSTVDFDSYGGVFPFADIPIITSQTVYWKSDGTAADSRMETSGFVL